MAVDHGGPHGSLRTVTVRRVGSDHVSEMPAFAGLALGGLFAAAGLLIVFIALDWVPVDPSSVHAPRWVLGVAGGVFVFPGFLMMYYGLRTGLRDVGWVREDLRRSRENPWAGPSWFVGASVITAFAAIALWVGFGDGHRQFSGGITGSEGEGRVVFGSIGVLCAVLAAWVWGRGMKEIGARLVRVLTKDTD